MSFMDNLQKQIEDASNASVTENGALGYRTTGKALLDLNFSVASMRQMDEGEILEKFGEAWHENPELAFKWLFYARDIRGGLGERRLFRIILHALSDRSGDFPGLDKAVYKIAEYGRWDDLFCLFNTQMQETALDCIASQLALDISNKSKEKPISLLTKWLPSINTSSDTSRKMAKRIIRYLGLSEKDYRKILSDYRSYIKVVERQMSDNQWDEINYESVPSKANLIYGNAFARHDPDRRAEYLAKVSTGEAKINSGTLFPHEIVSKLRHDPTVDHNLMNELWKALPNVCQKDTRTLVVADGSGSMETCINGSGNAQALDVAMAMAIYFSEKLKGEFANKFVTFSTNPRFVDISKCTNLEEKIGVMRRHCEVSDTNIEAVFDLVLITALQNEMKQEELPDNILIISDMEFNRCAVGNRGNLYNPMTGQSTNPRLFDVIAEKFSRAGYKLPRLIFWNVCSRTGTIPVKENDMGVALVSGFSINILNLVMSDILDPYELLANQLMSERYAPITLGI